MRENYRMLYSTQEAIGERIRQIRGRIQENTDSLRGLYKDGDMMDDPLLHRLLKERERLEGEVTMMQKILGAPDFIREEELFGKQTISVGHEVDMDVEYPNGERESLVVTIGTSIDKKFLESILEGGRHEHVILSEESPIISVLIGRERGEEVEYSAGMGRGKIRINDFRVSPLISGATRIQNEE